MNRAKAAQALLWKLAEDEGAELVLLAGQGLQFPFPFPLLGVALGVAILEDWIVDVELGL